MPSAAVPPQRPSPPLAFPPPAFPPPASAPPASPSLVPLPPAADVVVIGGGIVGASVAFHLAEAGVSDVLVLERGTLASGSSGKPIGGVRAQFSDPLNIEMGARGLRAYADFERRPGADIRLDTVGYLFLLTTEASAAEFARGVRTQNELGVPSRMVEPKEAARLCPYVATEGLVAGAFSPDAGHARPVRAVEGYARAAAARGVTFATGTTVTGIDTTADRVTAVATDRGRVRCRRTAVCAAGAWSAGIGEMVGVPLPVRPVRRQLAFTTPLRPPAPRVPFTIDFASSAYFHNSDDGLLLGLADPAQPDGFDTTWTPDWLPLFREAARRRAPAVAGMESVAGWAGLYEVTPDHNALIGRATGMANFLYATGFSGHGFLQAPAVGEIVRDLHLERDPFVDIGPLSADRFAAGSGREVRPEAHVV